jgi:uncharacterized repeat protein (TIGR03806 family)
MKFKYFIIVLFLILSCSRDYDDRNRVSEYTSIISQETINFEDKLSHYNIFKGNPSKLIPNDKFEVLELNSKLFTDYSYKQRLVNIPDGKIIDKKSNGELIFPNGTILTKTFFYPHDERDWSKGKKIIETRLEIKEKNTWNIATYIWNDEQTDAFLNSDGKNVSVSWINSEGNNQKINYEVPNSNQCVLCHQSNLKVTPIGPTLKNLNLLVNRNGLNINQLSHLQSNGFLTDFSIENIGSITNYEDPNNTLNERFKSYLFINCAHCHNPEGWEESSRKPYDFRYETPLINMGIIGKENKLHRVVNNGRMPYLGTTIKHNEGIEIINEYLKYLKDN